MVNVSQRIKIISRTHIVLYVFGFYLLLMYLLLTFLIVKGHDYRDYLLRDDGYYSIAGNFAKGIFNSGSVIGPGLPLIYTPIHFFNESWHPFVRLLISQLAVLMILFIVSKLTEKYLNNVQLFLGLIMIIIHPVFIQWTFRTSVDLFLSVFLGIFLLYFLKYLDSDKVLHIIISFSAFVYGIFLRPSFIFIPLILILTSIILLRKKRIAVISIILFVISVIGYLTNNLYLQSNVGSQELKLESGRSITVIYSFILTETILETGQFHKGTIDNYHIQYSNEDLKEWDKGVDYLDFKVSGFVKEYRTKYPDRSFMHMIWHYVKEHPGVAFAKVLFGPAYFFALSSRELLSYVLLMFFIIYSILVLLSLKQILQNNGNVEYFIIFFSVLFGYFLLHWVTHAYSRYSLVVLPYLFIWTGPQIAYVLSLKKPYCQ